LPNTTSDAKSSDAKSSDAKSSDAKSSDAKSSDAKFWAGRADAGTTEGAIAMTEIVFYQLQRQPLERVLPTLIEKSLERGWRVIVQAASEERVEALDAQLWIFRDDSFLPHGTWREAEASEQPILLTLDGDNPNGAAVRFLIDGAPMPTDAEAYRRIVLIVDGEDPDAVEAARQRWSEGKAKGLDVTYWRPDEEGRWQRLG
jgi:DNA polymerase-3 subunit chi